MISMEDNNPWVIGYILKEQNGLFSSSSTLVVVEFNENVRRAGLVHKCDNSCEIKSSTNVVHSTGILDGGHYKVLKRYDGFPPHLG